MSSLGAKKANICKANYSQFSNAGNILTLILLLLIVYNLKKKHRKKITFESRLFITGDFQTINLGIILTHVVYMKQQTTNALFRLANHTVHSYFEVQYRTQLLIPCATGITWGCKFLYIPKDVSC